MYKSSVFVSDIIENVLILNPTSEEYTTLGVVCDRNVFHKCISRDRKYINYTCAIALKNLIIREINKDSSKKESLNNYFKKYLSENIIKYIEQFPDCTEKIINLAILEFINPGDIKIGDFKENNFIHPVIQNISDMYIRIAKYLRNDIKTSFILLEKTIDQIIAAIVEHEDIACINSSTGKKKIINTLSYKKIIPKEVVCQIKQFTSLFSDNQTNKLTHFNNKYIELLFSNIKLIMEWFFKDYWNNEIYFSKVYTKAYEKFYKENNSDIKVYSLIELKKKGWTLEKFAQEMLNLFYKTIDNLANDNVSTIDEMIEIIKTQNETNKLLINSKDVVIGCWTLDPLFDDYFDKDKKGEFYVSEFTDDVIPIFIPGNIYNIHFGAICLVDEYKNTNVFKILLYSIVEYIEKLAINDIFINEICTQTYSKNGRALAKSLGFEYYTEHKDGHGQVYVGTISKLLDRTFMKDFEVLRTLYKSKFKTN